VKRSNKVNARLRVVHYVNQLFGGIGGEDRANVEPQAKDGFVGPGKLIQDTLQENGEVIATLICGDNYFVEKTEEATEDLLRLLTPYRMDVLIAGPAFNAGRYGVACGELCKIVQKRLGIPAVTGMYEENPGVDLYKRSVYIVKTADSVKGMAAAIPTMVNIARKLAAKERIGKPAEEGYFARGFFKNEPSDKIAAERAVDMLLAKLKGHPFESEVIAPEFDQVVPAAAVRDVSTAKIALVTDGGLVPKGNPDKLTAGMAKSFGEYNFRGFKALKGGDYEAHHVGHETSVINEDPNRLVPVDVMRVLEEEGIIGKLHETFYTTAGVGTTMNNSKRIGKGIAERLKAEGVTAVILTST
jgi:betaine reductase